MDYSVHSQIISFIWSIADGCLGGIVEHGKYCDDHFPTEIKKNQD